MDCTALSGEQVLLTDHALQWEKIWFWYWFLSFTHLWHRSADTAAVSPAQLHVREQLTSVSAAVSCSEQTQSAVRTGLQSDQQQTQSTGEHWRTLQHLILTTVTWVKRRSVRDSVISSDVEQWRLFIKWRKWFVDETELILRVLHCSSVLENAVCTGH